MSQELVTLLKNKRKDKLDLFMAWRAPHPHRLAEISVTGSLSYTYDERETWASPVESDEAAVSIVTVDDLSGLASVRIHADRYPMYEAPDSPDPGSFYLHHVMGRMWEFGADIPTLVDVVCGTHTIERYTYTSGAWVLDTTSTEDLLVTLVVAITLGGWGTPKGYDVDENDTSKADVEATMTFDSLHGELLPDPLNVDGLRLPWEDEWDPLVLEEDYTLLGDEYIGSASFLVHFDLLPLRAKLNSRANSEIIPIL